MDWGLTWKLSIVFAAGTIMLFTSSGISEAEVVSEGNSSNLSSASTESVSIDSGSVMAVSITEDIKSDNWAGVYGNASGRFILGEEDNTIFSWGSSNGKYVYADEDGINFSADWRNSTAADMESEYSFLANSSEGAKKTFNSTFKIDSVFQNDTISTVGAYTMNGTGDNYWPTAYLSDGEDGFFAGKVLENGRSFNNKIADYQMVLPEKGYENNKKTSYSVWIELE